MMIERVIDVAVVDDRTGGSIERLVPRVRRQRRRRARGRRRGCQLTDQACCTDVQAYILRVGMHHRDLSSVAALDIARSAVDVPSDTQANAGRHAAAINSMTHE